MVDNVNCGQSQPEALVARDGDKAVQGIAVVSRVLAAASQLALQAGRRMVSRQVQPSKNGRCSCGAVLVPSKTWGTPQQCWEASNLLEQPRWVATLAWLASVELHCRRPAIVCQSTTHIVEPVASTSGDGPVCAVPRHRSSPTDHRPPADKTAAERWRSADAPQAQPTPPPSLH